MTFKYLVYVDGCSIFSPSIPHDKEAQGREVLGAGFVRLNGRSCDKGIAIDCYGCSDGLGIENRGIKDIEALRLWGGLL
jgi:hypothetical protein